MSDPHTLANWTKLSDESYTAPAELTLKDQRTAWRASATEVHQPPREPDPLARLPAGHTPPTHDAPPAVIEVMLDRALLEPDLFSGGYATIGGQRFPIFYSTGGPAHPRDSVAATRIALPADTPVSAGQTLELTFAEPLADVPVRRFEKQNGTRAAIEVTAESHASDLAYLLGGRVTVDTGAASYVITQAQRVNDRMRLELKTVAPAKAADAAPPSSATIEPPSFRSLVFEGSVDETVLKSPGGEIAVESIVGGERVMHVLRIVSDIDRPANFDLLVRLPQSAEAARSALQPGKRCHYYAPYRITLSVDVTDATGADIDLPLAPDAGSRSLYLAVSTVDRRNNQGALSIPVQAIAVRPPPTARPGRPYPCNHRPDVAEAYTTPPDRRGRATVCLAWDAGELDSTDGLRFEVQRTLDNTIIATHRRNWLRGKASVMPPLTASPQLQGTLNNHTTDETRGLSRANFTTMVPDVDFKAFKGGRLAQGAHYFQITGVDTPQNGPPQLLLRPATQEGATPTAPSDGTCILEAAPDYTVVRADTDALRLLAERNDDAFGLVTGVPVAETRFIDEILGIGRNRFFYRVRAVDAAENRSPWSEISAPFYQVDTTAPGAPAQFQVMAGDRSATLVWLPPQDTRIVTYHVYRLENETAGSHHLTLPIYKRISRSDIQPRRIHILAGSVTLPSPLTFRVDANATEHEIASHVMDNIVVRTLHADQTSLDFYIRDADLTQVSQQKIQHLNPLVTDGTRVVVALGNPADPQLLTQRSDGSPLTVQSGEIDLGVDASTADLVAVYRYDEEMSLAWSILSRSVKDISLRQSSLALYTRADQTDGTQSIAVHTLKHLNPLVTSGTAVSIQFGASVLDADPAQVVWVDDEEGRGLSAIPSYTYRITAIKRVYLAPKNAGQPPQELEIPSPVTAPVTVRVVDQSIPPAPTITSAFWVDASDAATATAADALRIKVEVASAFANIKEIRIQRRTDAAQSWRTVQTDDGQLWFEWHNTPSTLTIFDSRVDRNRSWQYRAQLRTHDNRLGAPSSIATVSPP